MSISKREFWLSWIEGVESGEECGEELFFDHKTQGLDMTTVRSLKRAKLYERTILALHVHDRLKKDGSNYYLSDDIIDKMWTLCDPQLLLAAGEPLPRKRKLVTLYRGLSGRERDITGVSWTDTLGIACRFALRFRGGVRDDDWGYDPAVYTVTIPTSKVRAYLNRKKGEREFLYYADATDVQRLDGDLKDIRRGVDGWGWCDDWKMRQTGICRQVAQTSLKSEAVSLEDHAAAAGA